MARWNRWVSYDGTEFLVVSDSPPRPDPGNPANPPALSNHDPRTDTALVITTYEADRTPNGATINYHAVGDVVLTGISMKDGSGIPAALVPRVLGNGNLLTLTDTGLDGTDYDYYVDGTVNGAAKQTQDPKIRNRGV